MSVRRDPQSGALVLVPSPQDLVVADIAARVAAIELRAGNLEVLLAQVIDDLAQVVKVLRDQLPGGDN